MHRYQTELYCIQCKQNTLHLLSYAGNYLRSIRCEQCGRTIKISRLKVLEHFSSDFLDRIITKPHRINDELKQDFQKCLRTLPARIITKPFRTYREIKEVVKDDD